MPPQPRSVNRAMARPGSALSWRGSCRRRRRRGSSPGRPHPPRLELHARAQQPLARRGRALSGTSAWTVSPVHCRSARRARPPGRRAARAGSPSGMRRWPGTRAWRPARGRARPRPGRSDPVVVPRLASRDPAAADPARGAVDVEHLEHRLQPAAGQFDAGLEQARRHRPVSLGQRPERRPDLPLGREGERGEVPRSPGPRGPAAGSPRRLPPAPGPPDLLVVRDRRRRSAQVHDEAEVRLVEAHPERRGRHQRLDPVVDQVVLGLCRSSCSSAPSTPRPASHARAGTPPSPAPRRPSVCR